jgi:hypothetical protein
MPKSLTRWKRLPTDFITDYRDDRTKGSTYWVALNLESIVDDLPDDLQKSANRVVTNYIEDYERFTLTIARMVEYRDALQRRLKEYDIDYSDLHHYYYPVIPGDG